MHGFDAMIIFGLYKFWGHWKSHSCLYFSIALALEHAWLTLFNILTNFECLLIWLDIYIHPCEEYSWEKYCLDSSQNKLSM